MCRTVHNIYIVVFIHFRLEAYDRNFNFGASNTIQPEFHMDLPDKSHYKDINSDSHIPRFMQETLTNHLETYDAQLNDKVKDFYKNQYISYIRYLRKDNLTFIHAKISSEYRKGTRYYIDVSLDDNGIIQECQCDCTSGQGPGAHCKHVQTGLWALSQWTKTGRIITEETCTQVLQTFHKAKKMTGSPAKTIDLDLGTDENFDFEPRPAKYIGDKGYEDFVRNLVTNFPHSHPMPIEGIITPANPQAIALDHTYSINNPDEQFLIDNSI